jgi:serine/threonine protein kinase
MPPHILSVYQSSIPGKKFIAKKVRERSHEVEILTYLNNLRPMSEHIISLHASFKTQSTSWIILPKMDSVQDYVSFAPERLDGKLSDVCWGLIKGVAYLHKLRIAHRDIKPANLLLDPRDFCLKIIDFDIAMQVEDEDEEVNGEYGTEDWMAPEIINMSYSPIKADRWSSGKVVLYLFDELGNEDPYLRSIALKLTARNPNRRPSMLGIALPVSDVPNVAGDRKTKTSRSLEVEVDEENTKPPKAKKQRCTVLLDWNERVAPITIPVL